MICNILSHLIVRHPQDPLWYILYQIALSLDISHPVKGVEWALVPCATKTLTMLLTVIPWWDYWCQKGNWSWCYSWQMLFSKNDSKMPSAQQVLIIEYLCEIQWTVEGQWMILFTSFVVRYCNILPHFLLTCWCQSVSCNMIVNYDSALPPVPGSSTQR